MTPIRAETLHATILLALVAGLALALYSGYEAANPSAASACSFTPGFSCASVLNSGRTSTGGIPDWEIGVAGFVAMLAVDLPLYRTWQRRWLVPLLGLSAVGLGFAAYLASIELLVIRAFCPVCVGTYVADAVVLGSALALFRRTRAEPARSASERERTPSGDRASSGR